MPRLEAVSVPRDILTYGQAAAVLAYVEKHHEKKYAITFRCLLATGFAQGRGGQAEAESDRGPGQAAGDPDQGQAGAHGVC
jgi:hypothetical protein